MDTMKNYLEMAFYISGIVLSIAALFGLEQIRVLKRDTALRSERAAKEKAIEYSSRYLTRFVSLINKFSTEAGNAKLPLYSHSDLPVGDFTFESIPKKRVGVTYKLWTMETWCPAMNELEAISAAFVTGVADETTGFDIIGGSYCSSVQTYYDILAFSADGDRVRRYYKSITALYHLWAPRLSEADLRKVKDRIEAELDAIMPSASKKSIGVD